MTDFKIVKLNDGSYAQAVVPVDENGNVINNDVVEFVNAEGGNIEEGDIVKVNSSIDEAVEKCGSATDIEAIGVVVNGGANGETVTVAVKGKHNIKINDSIAISRGSSIEASPTAGIGYSGFFGTGTLAVILEEYTNTGVTELKKCIIQPTERY